ncbi:bifunctional adenosylcobinamide kinase/adenosylcobinamide-phosphate guanylyltransferase [Paenibacillus sp. GCM10023252]|uniref:bifunctional adenosylcobinamide kinase/adenosylcobinamide-phosphate guanylyltransferase n=1 Tax=Paenibacillus sp. GCM10023252 TaxID=3252649 RepID=UPI0036225FF3
MAILITGGARSGKSSFAEQLAMRSASSGIYIATSRVWDREMEDRIGKHKQDREASGFPWETVEEPMELTSLLKQLSALQQLKIARGERASVVLVDCLTLWLSNQLLELEEDIGADSDLDADADGDGQAVDRFKYAKEASLGNDQQAMRQVERIIHELVEDIRSYPYPLILVTNEVGSGVVPAYALGRKFRDAAGQLNQRAASVCKQVFLVTAGIPVDMKRLAFQWEDWEGC